MNIPNEMNFRVRVETALFTSIFGILVMGTGFVIAIIALFVNNISGFYRILASISAILFLVYGMYYICSLWVTHLVVSHDEMDG